MRLLMAVVTVPLVRDLEPFFEIEEDGEVGARLGFSASGWSRIPFIDAIAELLYEEDGLRFADRDVALAKVRFQQWVKVPIVDDDGEKIGSWRWGEHPTGRIVSVLDFCDVDLVPVCFACYADKHDQCTMRDETHVDFHQVGFSGSGRKDFPLKRRRWRSPPRW